MSSIDPKELSALMSLPYSVETQTKIAKLLNADGDEQSQVATEEHFEGALMFLSITSSKIVGKPTTLSHSFASAVLGKICLTAMSAQALFRDHEVGKLPTLDHSSIAVLSRTIIESSIGPSKFLKQSQEPVAQLVLDEPQNLGPLAALHDPISNRATSPIVITVRKMLVVRAARDSVA
jgi:hypothetical protein